MTIGRKLGIAVLGLLIHGAPQEAMGQTESFARAADTKADADGSTDIYLLMGQSNMSGRGDLTELSGAEGKENGTILLYGNDGKWRAAVEPLDGADRQVDAVSADPGSAAVGPGLFFARALQQGHKGAVGLVPCAKGGSKLSAWLPGGSRDTLYGSCLARAREASGIGRIAGILWYQGESDTKTLEEAQRWPKDFSTLASALRHDLKAPDLPIVLVGLADHPPGEMGAERPYWQLIQAGQAALKIRCARTVSAAGLPLKADGLHLTTSAQRRLGPALATAMIRLRHSPACH